jgi:hypothetical protein
MRHCYSQRQALFLITSICCKLLLARCVTKGIKTQCLKDYKYPLMFVFGNSLLVTRMQGKIIV